MSDSSKKTPKTFPDAFAEFKKLVEEKYAKEVVDRFPQVKPIRITVEYDTYYSENNHELKEAYFELLAEYTNNKTLNLANEKDNDLSTLRRNDKGELFFKGQKATIDDYFIMIVDSIFVNYYPMGLKKNSIKYPVYMLYTPSAGFRNIPEGSGMTQWYDVIRLNNEEFRLVIDGKDLINDFSLMAGKYFFSELTSAYISARNAESGDLKINEDIDAYQSNHFKQLLDQLLPLRLGSRIENWAD